MRIKAYRREIALMLLVGAVGAACTGSGDGGGTPTPSRSGRLPVQVVVANYEIVAGESSRLLVGLITEDGETVAYGSVQMRFAQDTGAAAQATEAVTGTYLPVYGTEAGDPNAKPETIRPSTARGVYATYGVRFSDPGSYVIEVAADVQGIGIVQGATRFDVIAKPVVPGVDERAPRTENLTLDSPDAPEAVDSRASSGEIPDPELHQVTIADAVRQGRAALVVFSTPVFCVSRFCGPVTDLVQSLAAQYSDRAAFIHVEIWRDFEDNVINQGAADWLYHNDELNEPWAFLIGADGKIVARWDNLFVEDELRDALEALPAD
ncbi:MAG: TlpA family protein disulfide reductase [Actinomycetota bacterium]